MASPLNLGYPPVLKSITNPLVKGQDALDRDFPMPFLTFIKTINSNFEPEALQNYYNYYIQLWNEVSSSKSFTSQQIIVEKYQEFLKEISLNYSTLEEKKFLKKIDFTDPYDLDIAIGFYSRKLKEISLFYNKKREDAKFELTRKKLKGTNFGIERSLKELIIENLENFEESKILIDIESVKRNLEIEIDEFFDVYPLYYNSEPSKLYDDKDLDYGRNIFLRSDADLIAEVFAGVSPVIREIKEADELFENKRKLTEKYMATDFYYLSTGATTSQFLSGKLFDAVRPSSNFANRDFPTTASTERNFFQSYREKGFFKPSNTSIITVDGKNSTYFFNLENLTPNTIYYFADPAIMGDNGDILTFIVDDGFLKKNFSCGNAVNQPNSTPNDTKYNGYHSLIDPNLQKYMDSLFDKGYIHDSKRDLFNNLYGLVKKDNFQESITSGEEHVIKSLVLNGHTFYDDLYGEGYNFNYATVDDTTFTETVRSGLSSNTNGFSGLSSFYTLNFRYFSPYDELIAPTENNLIQTYEILDGAFFLNNDNAPYDDSISSDLSAFPGNGVYFYNELIEGGLHSASPVQRALLDPAFPTLTANMTQSLRPDGLSAFMVDGGYFLDPFNFDYSFITNEYAFINETSSPSQYQLSAYSTENLFNRYELPGTIYVKNVQSRQVLPILNACPYMLTKYESSIIAELSAVSRFEIANDSIFIETENHLTIDKIGFREGNFVDPKLTSFHISLTGNDAVSNRFKIKDKVYYGVLTNLVETLSSNNAIVYPKIYEYNITKNENTLIFPSTLSDITSNTDFFSISGGNIRYTSFEAPQLTYNSRNNIFNISFLAKDQNNLIYLQEFDVDALNPSKFISHNRFKPTNDQVSNIFYSNYNTTLNVYMSSGPPTVTAQELIV